MIVLFFDLVIHIAETQLDYTPWRLCHIHVKLDYMRQAEEGKLEANMDVTLGKNTIWEVPVPVPHLIQNRL